ncbi:lipoate--protein ligase [Gorillibacterium massiliense]|uniref:lipoate--protein ligase n=1 Tax=Gorillibacterium massiliense TaxID=1280390 RepID=UPI0005928525|nr:lipoate--protein ligase [Gorillibacterium massiliense]
MLFIDNEGITDAQINLAIEEYALRNLPIENDYLLFYINAPSIIIGKNQNTMEEINYEYVQEHGIHVVRRLSGGGAVYHDLGNLNFSFITRDDGNSFHNFQKFTEPVINALRKLGVEAELSGRNDIQVGERKISGNAQFSHKGRMFSHGTLLFDSHMEDVNAALKVNPEKIKSKGIKSIRSRVANISEFLDKPMTIEEFKQFVLESIFDGQEVQQYRLTPEDWDGIHELSKERYANWDWNYGKSPESNFRATRRLASGTFDVRLQIAGGLIESANIYGDFFGLGDVSDVEETLKGVRYDREAVTQALKDTDIKRYFGNIEASDFIDLLF